MFINVKKATSQTSRESFFDFVREFWSEIIQDEPVWNWHLEYMCNELQKVAERVFANKDKKYDLIINIPPGTTKSTICSIMFPAWTWTRMQKARHICGTHTFDLGMDLSRKCRDICESDRYRYLFPWIGMRRDQNTKSYFVNSRGGYRKSVTVGGKSPMGFHGHFIIIDDPIDPERARSMSEASIKAANNWMNETAPTRKVSKTVTPTILVMQRLHQNDPSGNWLQRVKEGKSGKVKHICLPADMNDGYAIKPKKLIHNYRDGLLDPIRLNRKALKELKGVLGEYGYAGQIGQRPVPLGGGMFKINRLLSEPVLPVKLKRVCRYWDKAGTPGGGDYTAGVLMGVDYHGHFYILNVIRDQLDSGAREDLIYQTAVRDQATYGSKLIIGIEQEPGSGGKESAENTAKRLRGFRSRIDKVTGDKVIRADPFSVQVNARNVTIVGGGNWVDEFVDELQFFPFSTHDDMVDAASGAFAILNAARVVGALGGQPNYER